MTLDERPRARGRRPGSARPPRRGRSGRLRGAGTPPSRPAVGGRAAHARRPRGGRRRRAGRTGLGLPGRPHLPRAVGRHDLAAPHHGERLSGPGPQGRLPTYRARRRTTEQPRTRSSNPHESAEAPAERERTAPRAPRAPWRRCPPTSGPPSSWWTCRAIRSPRRPRSSTCPTGHGEEPVRPRPGPTAAAAHPSAGRRAGVARLRGGGRNRTEGTSVPADGSK